MTVKREELGRRLRTAREACRMKQEDVAKHLGVSRSTVAQMELGKRAVTSLELDKLAYLFGRDIREFLAEEFREDDAVVALFRRHPEVADEEEVLQALRDCVALGREITNLERLLDIDRDATALASYILPTPRSKWDAIQQGQRIAEEERRRLGLGAAPLPDASEILESQGVRTAQVTLPEDVSGLTLVEPEIGVLVVANREHHVLRRRFSYAHEYCHVLLDREQRGTISRTGDRDDLLEVRANSFAANLLMPEEGVRQFIYGLAKGRPSRMQADVFDEEEVTRAEGRAAPGSQAIQLYDVVLLAHHFGVSCLSALFRLRNIRLITQSELDLLRQQDEQGTARHLGGVLGLPEPDHAAARNEFRRRFLGLGLEALRRGEITVAKLHELARMVDVSRGQIERVLEETGLDEHEEPADVLLPEA